MYHVTLTVTESNKNSEILKKNSLNYMIFGKLNKCKYYAILHFLTCKRLNITDEFLLLRRLNQNGTRPNEFGFMTARKGDSNRLKMIFYHHQKANYDKKGH